MQTPLFELLEGRRTVALIGMCKNAGKTTVLNHLVGCANAAHTPLGLTSIGRDGEDTDLVTGTGKPGIWVQRGTLVATAKNLLGECDITREILAATGLHTPLGEVVVLRALSDGAVQLAGPSMVAQLQTVNDMLLEFGAGMVLIDGALSRKTLSTRALSEACVLCTGASCGPSIEAVVHETAHFCRLALLPRVQDEAVLQAAAHWGDAKIVLVGNDTLPLKNANLAAGLQAHPGNGTRFALVRGAVTDSMLKPLVTGGGRYDGLTVVAQDASKLLVSAPLPGQLQTRGIHLGVLDSIRLMAVTVNPFSAAGNHFDPAGFLAKMQAAVPLPVYDVKEAAQ